jgi:hypothetical protein
LFISANRNVYLLWHKKSFINDTDSRSGAVALQDLHNILSNVHASLTDIGFESKVANTEQLQLLFQKLLKHWLLSSIQGLPAVLCFGPNTFPGQDQMKAVFVEMFPNHIHKRDPTRLLGLGSTTGSNSQRHIGLPHSSSDCTRELHFSKVVDLSTVDVGQITGDPIRIENHEECFTDYTEHQKNKLFFKTLVCFLSGSSAAGTNGKLCLRGCVRACFLVLLHEATRLFYFCSICVCSVNARVVTCLL